MLNMAIIMGRLTKDPEYRQTSNNVSTAMFSVAVERDYKKDGQDKETDFLDVVAWRNTAEFICKNFSKGQMIALYGRLQKRSYEDTNGNKRTVVEIIAESVYFCGPKPQQDGTGAFSSFNAGQFPANPNNGFASDFNGFIQSQPAPQFQQFAGQNIQQPAMAQPQIQSPNVQASPFNSAFSQAPSPAPQQTAAPQNSSAPNLIYNPDEWNDFDDLPF